MNHSVPENTKDGDNQAPDLQALSKNSIYHSSLASSQIPSLDTYNFSSSAETPNLNPGHLSHQDFADLPTETQDVSPIDKSADFAAKKCNLRRSSIPPPINVNDANLVAQQILKQKFLQVSPSPPITKVEKSFEKHDSEKVSIGVSTDRNRRYRRTMEDTHNFIHNFCGVEGQLFAAVFDGHAGKQASELCKTNFHKALEKNLKDCPETPIPKTIDNTFREIDYQISRLDRPNSGCTAAVAFIKINQPQSPDTEPSYELYCSNAGDARAVLSRGGKAVRLSYDHKGDDIYESNRVSDNGGFMINNRVNGVLAVTRSLGDSSMKKVVVGRPYITFTNLLKDDKLLILACDGLWDVCSDQDAIDIASKYSDAQEAAKALLTHALDNLSTDNLSIMVIQLNY